MDARHDPAMCARRPEGQPYPGLHTKSSVASRLSEVIVLLCSAPVRPQLEPCVQLWNSQHRKYMDLLELVQRRSQKMIRRLGHLSSEERLRDLGLLGREKRRLQGDLTAAFQPLKGGYKKVGTDFLVGPVAVGQGVMVLH